MSSIARILSLLFAFAPLAAAQVTAPPQDPVRTAPWPEEIRAIAARIPVQDGGRVKPFDTFARFKLLEFSGYRSVSIGQDDAKTSLSALEWMLDVLFFPRQATAYKVFLVEDYDVLSNVGMPITGLKKRDRYSFEQLLPFASQIVAKGAKIDESLRKNEVMFNKLDPIDQQIYNLALKLTEYESLQRTFQFARSYVDLESLAPTLAKEFPNQRNVSLAAFFEKLPEYVVRYDQLVARDGVQNPSSELREIDFVLSEMKAVAESSSAFHLLPPPTGEENWLSPSELVTRSSATVAGIERQIAMLANLAPIVPSDFTPFDAKKFASVLEEYRAEVTSLALLSDTKHEAQKIDLEVSFYGWNFFERAKWTFFGALVLACVLWLAPRSRHLYSLVWIGVSAPLVLLIAGIVVRCILRGRPPVSTFYETTLFISACAVIAALIIEWITRRRIALFLAAVLGYAGMYLAGWYEEVNRNDTMPQLQAVLDTNFWLSTHVTTVTIGYAAGLLAGAIAHVYLVAKLFGYGRNQPEFYRAIGRMVYGAIAFGLVFSTIGTILGGIWANDSWGRFWGWDPKENGALMIVLMNLILIHSRIGGFIRDFGLCMGAVVLAIVVNFSWFHVNVLGVGLHSYGFDEKVIRLMNTIYGAEIGVLAIGALAWVIDRRTERAVEKAVIAKTQPAN